VGVCIRVQADTFRTFPYENPFLAPFETAIKLLNPVVAIKMRSPSIHAALSTMYVSKLFVIPNSKNMLALQMPLQFT
jgi:hypothetical protein